MFITFNMLFVNSLIFVVSKLLCKKTLPIKKSTRNEIWSVFTENGSYINASFLHRFSSTRRTRSLGFSCKIFLGFCWLVPLGLPPLSFCPTYFDLSSRLSCDTSSIFLFFPLLSKIYQLCNRHVWNFSLKARAADTFNDVRNCVSNYLLF